MYQHNILDSNYFYTLFYFGMFAFFNLNHFFFINLLANEYIFMYKKLII